MSDLYYRHSGQYPVGGLVAALVAAVLAGGILSYAYAYLLLYIPLAGYVTLLLTGGFGFLLGYVTAYALRKMKVRSMPASYGVMGIVGLTALYASWAVWIYALLRREDYEADLFAILQDPAGLWNVMTIVNKAGAWSISSWTPTDMALWFIWGLEAVTILGVAFFFLHTIMTKDPFCESCGTWCEEAAGVARLTPAEKSEVRQRLELKDYNYLEKLGRVAANAAYYLELNLHGCPNCHMTNTLTAHLVTITVNKKGQSQASKDLVADKLLVNSSDTETVRTIGQKSAGPAAPATSG